MNVRSVRDLDSTKCYSEEYDVLILACGSEPRCTHVMDSLVEWGVDLERAVVLHIAEATDPAGMNNLGKFSKVLTKCPKEIGINDEMAIYSFLSEFLNHHRNDSEPMRILVDYSSMPRLWYAAIISWFVMQELPRCIIDFVYSAGKYVDDWKPKEGSAIVNVAGCGSVTSLLSPKLLILGLGFDGLAPFSLFNWVEPDEVIAYAAYPASSEGVIERVKSANNDFLAEYCSGDCYLIPLRSVESAYRLIGECVSVLCNESSVILAPLGPKPHILASVLLCHKFTNTTCLMMEHEHDGRYQTEASGEIIVTRVEMVTTI